MRAGVKEGRVKGSKDGKEENWEKGNKLRDRKGKMENGGNKKIRKLRKDVKGKIGKEKRGKERCRNYEKKIERKLR